MNVELNESASDSQRIFIFKNQNDSSSLTVTINEVNI